ncbi:MAG: Patatin [uncultured Sulfurovum sp.]|uniref:Patatin n=1 Tax=uncultured Sulfurovum sp. TaxID=269237 RepID=A0A6S6S8Z2_9BACT|nr:MAG: Patatin [uncultured Sulfurovum sp.]
METKRQYGLALGGGAVLGAAHIGVLRAIEENEIELTHITGTSVGALIGTLFAFGKSSQEIADIMIGINWRDIADFSMSKLGLFSNDKIGKLIHEHFGDITLEEANIPLGVVVTDLALGEKVLLEKGSAKEAVMASTCIPSIFKPIEKEEMLLVDGGLVENVPLESLRKIGAENAIVVDLNASSQYHKPENFVEVLINSANYFIECRNKIEIYEKDIHITPDLSAFNAIQTSQIEAIIEVGYEEAKKILNKKV